jgi:ABC-type sugar transport system substrate-binding protein
MDKKEKFVITVNRELGSGGRTVGRLLSKNWLLAAILTICVVSMFTSCVNNNDNPIDGETGASSIVMIGKLGQVEYWQQVESAFRTACQKADVEALYHTTATENACQEQVVAVEQLK